MIKFKIDHYEHPYELRDYWFWTVENPEIVGPHYTRKSDCKRGLGRVIDGIQRGDYTIEEVKE